MKRNGAVVAIGIQFSMYVKVIKLIIEFTFILGQRTTKIYTK